MWRPVIGPPVTFSYLFLPYPELEPARRTDPNEHTEGGSKNRKAVKMEGPGRKVYQTNKETVFMGEGGAIRKDLALQQGCWPSVNVGRLTSRVPACAFGTTESSRTAQLGGGPC